MRPVLKEAIISIFLKTVESDLKDPSEEADDEKNNATTAVDNYFS